MHSVSFHVLLPEVQVVPVRDEVAGHPGLINADWGLTVPSRSEVLSPSSPVEVKAYFLSLYLRSPPARGGEVFGEHHAPPAGILQGLVGAAFAPVPWQHVCHVVQGQHVVYEY